MIELNKIYQGDALEVLKTWPDEFIDLVITSPPYYALRNYGVEGQLGLENSFEEYQEKLLMIIQEIKRVLKSTGQFWLNLGDVYGGNMGWTEQYINKKQWHQNESIKRFGNNIKTSTLTNPKSLLNKGRAGNQKCLTMIPERIVLKMIEDDWILRNKIKWAKQILDFKENKTKGSVMPTSVKDRFNESGEELYFFVKNKKYYSNLDAVRMPAQTIENRSMGIDREKEYPEAKRNKFAFNYRVRDAERKLGQPQFKESEKEIKNDRGRLKKWQKQNKLPANYLGPTGVDHNLLNNPNGKNLPTIWLIQSEPHNFRKELEIDIDHFAIFPQALVEIPIKFGSPEKGLVCDPFMGSGTTAYVARQFGRNYIGIEINKDYIEMANKRLAQQMLL